jgi:hypothetical protein
VGPHEGLKKCAETGLHKAIKKNCLHKIKLCCTRKSLPQELWGSHEPRFNHEAVSVSAPRRVSAPPPGSESCTSARAHRAIVCRRHCSLARASSFLLRAIFPGLCGPGCGNTSQNACTQHPSTPPSTPAHTSTTIGDDRVPELAPGTSGKSTGGRSGPFWLRIRKGQNVNASLAARVIARSPRFTLESCANRVRLGRYVIFGACSVCQRRSRERKVNVCDQCHFLR